MLFDSRSEESDLLILLSRGDLHAFARIYKASQETVFRYALYLTRSPVLAEEITQEVFVRIWERRELFDAETRLSAYIRRMAENLVFDHFRKAARSRELVRELSAEAYAAKQDVSEDFAARELTRAFQQAVQKLPPQQKLVFLLQHDHEFTYQQIAEKLKISVHTVRNHLAQASKAVRMSVRDYAGTVIPMLLKLFFMQN